MQNLSQQKLLKFLYKLRVLSGIGHGGMVFDVGTHSHHILVGLLHHVLFVNSEIFHLLVYFLLNIFGNICLRAEIIFLNTAGNRLSLAVASVIPHFRSTFILCLFHLFFVIFIHFRSIVVALGLEKGLHENIFLFVLLIQPVRLNGFSLIFFVYFGLVLSPLFKMNLIAPLVREGLHYLFPNMGPFLFFFGFGVNSKDVLILLVFHSFSKVNKCLPAKIDHGLIGL